LKSITIEPADTVPMATSARRRLRLNLSLNQVSVVCGQDQRQFNELSDML
jgi:hypothetical protein